MKSYLLIVLFLIPINLLSQTNYHVGGNVYLNGIDIGLTQVKASINLDNTQYTTTSFANGLCNYYFESVPSGIHHLQISSNSTITIDSMININRSSLCGDGANRYNFNPKVGIKNNGREFKLKQNINDIWKYSYDKYEYKAGGFINETKGIHFWKTVAVENNSNVTTLTILNDRNDSIISLYNNKITKAEFKRDTVIFSIVLKSDSIFINCSEIPIYYRKIPKYCLSISDSLKFIYPEIFPTSSSAVYRDSIGIFNYSFILSGNNTTKIDMKYINNVPDSPTDINIKDLKYPLNLKLDQNYPNPFNPSTTFSFSIPTDGFVSLKIFSIQGKEIETLIEQRLSGGVYNVAWNAGKLSSGIYYYCLKMGDQQQTKKMILLK